jgi:hypothetical protein
VDVGPSGQNKTVGSIQIRYCGFSAIGCGCAVDLTGASGLEVGDKVLPWGSTDTCLSPADVTTDKTGARRVSVVFVEREETAMYGDSARRRNYTVVQPAFRSVLSKTRLNATAGDAAGVAAAAAGAAAGHVTVLQQVSECECV